VRDYAGKFSDARRESDRVRARERKSITSRRAPLNPPVRVQRAILIYPRLPSTLPPPPPPPPFLASRGAAAGSIKNAQRSLVARARARFGSARQKSEKRVLSIAAFRGSEKEKKEKKKKKKKGKKDPHPVRKNVFRYGERGIELRYSDKNAASGLLRFYQRREHRFFMSTQRRLCAYRYPRRTVENDRLGDGGDGGR